MCRISIKSFDASERGYTWSDSIIGWRQGTLSTEEASVEKGEETTVLRGDRGKKKK